MSASRRRRQPLTLLMKAALAPTGYLLSLIGVILPWQARNAYLNAVVGPICSLVLRSDTFVRFFMDIGFLQ